VSVFAEKDGDVSMRDGVGLARTIYTPLVARRRPRVSLRDRDLGDRRVGAMRDGGTGNQNAALPAAF
jgi:predicted acyl esterase